MAAHFGELLQLEPRQCGFVLAEKQSEKHSKSAIPVPITSARWASVV